jgi:hypothetical protein
LYALIFSTIYLKSSRITLVLANHLMGAPSILICIWSTSSPMRKRSVVFSLCVSCPFLRATITLHNPYLDFTDAQNVSTARCVNSARCILAAYYMLSGTSLDIGRLHPFVVVRSFFYDVYFLSDFRAIDLLVSCRSGAGATL